MKEKNIKVNAVLNMVKTISSIIFPLITFPYVSRVLMPENIGKITFGSSFVSYFALIASLGITTYAIRECSAKREDRNELSKTASQIFSINIVTTIIAYGLMAMTLLFFREFDAYRTLIIIQSTAILFATLGCDWLNSAMEDFPFITIRTIAFQFVSLALMFTFVHEPGDYMKYAAITVIAASGANVVNIFYRRKYCTIRFVKDMEWNRHFRPIALLFVMLLVQIILSSTDVTMLGLMKGDTEVGYYSTAQKVSGLISQVVASLVWVVMPRMALYFNQENYDKINELLKKILGVLLTLGLPSAIGCICMSQEIILIISGEEYLPAAPVLSVLMICFIFSLLGGSFLGNIVLLPSKREGVYLVVCFVATVIKLVMNYFMIPLGGANAAAWATAVSSFVIMTLLIITKDKRIKLNYFLQTVSAPAVGGVVIVITCALIKAAVPGLLLRSILCIGLSGLLYFAVQLILKNQVVKEFANALLNKLRAYKSKQ